MSPLAWAHARWAAVEELRNKPLFTTYPDWPVWRYVGPLLGFLTLSALAAYRELEGLLKATHLPGAGSFGAGDLPNLGVHLPDSGIPAEAYKTWVSAAPKNATGPVELAHWAMYVDVGLLVCYSLLFALWLIKTGRGLIAAEQDADLLDRVARRRLERTGLPAEPDAIEQASGDVVSLIDHYRTIVAVAFCAIPVVALLDLLENLLTLQSIGSEGKDWFWLLWVASLGKTVLFVFVVAAAAISTVALASFRNESHHPILGTLGRSGPTARRPALCGIAAPRPNGAGPGRDSPLGTLLGARLRAAHLVPCPGSAHRRGLPKAPRVSPG